MALVGGMLGILVPWAAREVVLGLWVVLSDVLVLGASVERGVGDGVVIQDRIGN